MSAAVATPAGEARSAPAARRVNRRVLALGILVVAPLLAVLVANLGRDPHVVDSPLVGRPAPAFALHPVEGGAPVALSAFRGRPVVVNFWATWCVPCVQEHHLLVSAARAAGNRAQFLGIVYEDEGEEIRRFLAHRGAAYPSLVDPGSRTAIAFGIFGVPETLFIDAEGRIAAKHVGPLDEESLRAKLRLAGLEP
jgi:cytochrome c biogenesis protein CcmG/thiol:disulfide interchange protein DsbE